MLTLLFLFIRQPGRWEDDMKSAEFSVLMSLYINERPEYFRECMESVLSQTVMPSEILIIKDGPVQEEVDFLLERYGRDNPGLIRTISYDVNRGLWYALALGVTECRYNLIARMDTDDIARNDRFEKQLREFEIDPELDICGSYIDEFEGEVSNIVARRTVPLGQDDIVRYQRRRDAFNHMTVMYKKSAVLAAGNYQECPLMEDTLLWVNMLRNGARCKNIPEPLVYARIGEEMYERRGGYRYFLRYRDGRRKVYDTGFISFTDYIYTFIIQFIVAMMPRNVRGFVFRKILHGNNRRQ